MLSFLFRNFAGILKISVWPHLLGPDGSLSFERFFKRHPLLSLFSCFATAFLLLLGSSLFREGFFLLSSDILSGLLLVLLSLVTFLCSFLPILDPFLLIEALGYETGIWYCNTGLLPGELDRGKMGEYRATLAAEKMLKRNRVSGEIFNNVLVPKKNGDFAEIDLIVVSPLGIDVIEAKARGGKFIGAVDDKYWTQEFGDRTASVYNPILQNRTHEKNLSCFLKSSPNTAGLWKSEEDILHFLTNVVLFSGSCGWSIAGSLHKAFHDARIIVGKDDCYPYIKREDRLLTNDQCATISDTIRKLCLPDKGIRESRMRNIISARKAIYHI